MVRLAPADAGIFYLTAFAAFSNLARL